MTDNRHQHGRIPALSEVPWHPHKPIGLGRALLKAGYATRRQAEEMVRQGRVRIGDEVITDPYHMADVGADIFLDDEILQRLAKRYFALHKPLRVCCGETDAVGLVQAQSYLPEDIPGLTAAGRMDGKTMGLLLFSNDSVWNNMLTTTKGLEQEYRVQVQGHLTDLEISVMTAGVHLPGMGLFQPQSVRVVETMSHQTVVNITVREGKVRQVRRMLATLRHGVTSVRRVRIGDIRLGDLSVGGYRELSNPEVGSVRDIHAVVQRKSGSLGG